MSKMIHGRDFISQEELRLSWPVTLKKQLLDDCDQIAAKKERPSPFLGACTAVGLHTQTLLVAAGGVAENAVRVSNPGKLRQTGDEQEIFDGFKVCTAPYS
jgi:hypothetical protein